MARHTISKTLEFKVFYFEAYKSKYNLTGKNVWIFLINIKYLII